MTTTTDLADGYYTVPAGKLANAVIWLEMRSPPLGLPSAPLPLLRVTAADFEACRRLFAAVGTPWLWSRSFNLREPGDVTHDTYFALDDNGRAVGLVELGGVESGDVEIVYFGLEPSAVGRGLGRRMMAAALDLAWKTAGRVWLHTCNFDHPAAFRFYRSCGFVPYASGFEIMDDPRLAGVFPPETAPHVPLIAPVLRT